MAVSKPAVDLWFLLVLGREEFLELLLGIELDRVLVTHRSGAT